MIETYKWHEVYKAAVLETDWTKMEERIQAAEAALHARKHEFVSTTVGRQKKIKPLWML